MMQSDSDPTPVFELAVAYWRSCALFSALELSVFDVLAEGPLTLATLAARVGVPERSLKMLADALVALGLLVRDGDGLANGGLARTYLRSDAPESLRETVLFNARSYAAWGKLTDAIRRGAPVVSPTAVLGDDPKATRNFVLAMHARAQGVARCLVDLLDLSGRRRLLDLGGGSAAYAALLAAKYPGLDVTVVDLPGVLAVAEELLRDAPGRERIHLRPGDISKDGFGDSYDAALVSGVLHRTEGEGTAALLRKVADALAPGGLLAISDIFVGGDRRGPVLPELFSLHMLLTSDQGHSLPLDHVQAVLADIGLRVASATAYPPPLPHTLLVAAKSS